MGPGGRFGEVGEAMGSARDRSRSWVPYAEPCLILPAVELIASGSGLSLRNL